MKKLLILMLVLGLASVANAQPVPIIITVGGVDVGAEYTMNVSDIVWIGVEDVGAPGLGHFTSWMVIAEDGGAAETGGAWTGGNVVHIPPGVPSAANTYLGYNAGFGDIWDLINAEPTINPSPTGLTAEYEFNCMELGNDVVIELWDSAGFVVVDTLLIHQVPEPATMLLLGLGGLLLRRRK